MPGQARAILRSELLEPSSTRPWTGPSHADRTETPAVIMVVGVNGTGKTTTVGKLARVLVAEDKDVLLGAADTFRAAAADQLRDLGRPGRACRPSAAPRERTRPASRSRRSGPASSRRSTWCSIDTAGRLHTKTGLMDELGKVKRVIERQAPVGEVLLVLDATTGQNGLDPGADLRARSSTSPGSC